MVTFCKLLFVLYSSAFAHSPDQLNFEYQELLEPYDKYSCNHQQHSEVSPYDWDVSCAVRGKTIKYMAHVAINFYPKTIFGWGSYEILYWVTDVSDPFKFHNTSSTIWIHNSSIENRIRVLEAQQGVENDRATLKLSYIAR